MEEKSFEKLQLLIEKRQSLMNMGGGEIFAGWGVLILLSIGFQIFFPAISLFSLGFYVLGAILQIFYVQKSKEKSSHKLFWDTRLSTFWLFMVAMILTVSGVMPRFFHLYDARASYCLVFLFLASGMFFSFLLTQKKSLGLSSFLFLSGSILTGLPFSIHYVDIISISVIFLAMVVCGLLCMLEERKKK